MPPDDGDVSYWLSGLTSRLWLAVDVYLKDSQIKSILALLLVKRLIKQLREL